MIETLLIGFLLGIRHAMESDHVAAVASLVSRSPSTRESVRLGSVWGLGHTLTLFIFGSAVLLVDKMIPEQIALTLEFIVGIMLVVLGIDVVRRFMRDSLHFHFHRHADGTLHWHAHTHEAEEASSSHSIHEHVHPEHFPLRALLIGIMHGMAGSAALIVLTLQSVHSFAMGLIYISLFGIGSIAGMALLSMIIMLPLRHSANRFAGLHQYLQLGIGSVTALLGISIMYGIANSV
ncbi:ABC-type nickel/cobalt efflux system, permease component RcnA [Mariprofundus aestuarium]|uniref:ABC-type nickel/cobalt efflux system, permease component RcnA n=1 Tax=Mariprofundus aestuarium TaxID=1921086 RepID=A0A2K8L241_MARES|nr:urease accessory protein [Mariprofundus aestuarium]ATX79014.1 ABC-type nickel/cobalt efflux system, permease component RcnA [Mariprofundus aestuarium]